ncbi:hypothetical protein HIM_07222 [Hirsutella minnesotensis 3608]|uniref:Magnesium transport protein CorA n=1 Tax=Hirsutella minnesotensis 3608 TaxID=1043627 RepID=A0A0F7ZTN6_9HYPO|nr:hypothetical protein HIM_07222 [Hirsutella minnesotensis 3608]
MTAAGVPTIPPPAHNDASRPPESEVFSRLHFYRNRSPVRYHESFPSPEPGNLVPPGSADRFSRNFSDLDDKMSADVRETPRLPLGSPDVQAADNKRHSAKSRSDSDIHHFAPRSWAHSHLSQPHSTISPSSSAVHRRRSVRAPSAVLGPLEDCDELDDGSGDAPYGTRPGWHPGSEPGYDPELPDGGHASVPTLGAPCDITVVDWSFERIVTRRFDNDAFIEFLDIPQEDWVKCRWINVNGLSWDVIQAIGSRKGLHKLALEDIMNLRNRTKADWYPNHAFIVMTLQKLINISDSDSEQESDADSDANSILSRNHLSSIRKLFRPRYKGNTNLGIKRRNNRETRETGGSGGSGRTNLAGSEPGRSDMEKGVAASEATDETGERPSVMLRSLQRYHASGNEARTRFLEEHSSLAPYKMAVSAEQVSILLTNDNTAISFFEASAEDVERPIVTRLSTPGTILRESCDASLLVQAIIDAIIDLALPLTAVYTDLLGDIELDVLTDPSIKQSRLLYICISELNKIMRFHGPIENLVSVLRDHRTHLASDLAAREFTNPASGVIISPLTHTYLGDVLDHCIIIAEALQQLKQSSEDLISLIFNTISANQNESMKQLTTVTIIFLPLTFITGFFGQNFDKDFPEIHKGIWYFWACAVPTAIATVLILKRDTIYNWCVSLVQRQHILSIRKDATSRRRRRKLMT